MRKFHLYHRTYTLRSRLTNLFENRDRVSTILVVDEFRVSVERETHVIMSVCMKTSLVKILPHDRHIVGMLENLLKILLTYFTARLLTNKETEAKQPRHCLLTQLPITLMIAECLAHDCGHTNDQREPSPSSQACVQCPTLNVRSFVL